MTKIILIEDNDEIRENLEEFLELHNYSVLVAENGNVGIAMIEAELPDIVLCDVAMPQKNGYEVLEYMRSNPKTRCIPFIFITASAEQRDIAMGKMAGADDYLAKPFSTQQLLAAINKVLQSQEISK